VLQNLGLVEDRTKLILAEQERDLLRAFRARLFDKQVVQAGRLLAVSRRATTNRRATTKRQNKNGLLDTTRYYPPEPLPAPAWQSELAHLKRKKEESAAQVGRTAVGPTRRV
jgi:hypothetical protein